MGCRVMSRRMCPSKRHCWLTVRVQSPRTKYQCGPYKTTEYDPSDAVSKSLEVHLLPSAPPVTGSGRPPFDLHLHGLGFCLQRRVLVVPLADLLCRAILQTPQETLLCELEGVPEAPKVALRCQSSRVLAPSCEVTTCVDDCVPLLIDHDELVLERVLRLETTLQNLRLLRIWQGTNLVRTVSTCGHRSNLLFHYALTRCRRCGCSCPVGRVE